MVQYSKKELLLSLRLSRGIITARRAGDDVDECAQREVHRRSAAAWRGYIQVPSNEHRHNVSGSATSPPWVEIRPEMTLINYDRQVVGCRGEAAGPMAAGAFQMMRRGLQRQSSRWSFGRAETHACPGHQMSTRPSEPRMRCTAKLLQGGRATLATHMLPFGHGVAEKPWGRPIFQAIRRRGL
jgi:hypothetical protein